MDFPIDILDLPGALADAAWNGVPFYMPDSRHSVGRRVQRFFFPGRDDTAYQDLGAFDGPMRITGLLIGDLYASYARAIEAALRTPGPGTLLHPWLGELQMVLVEPANISFSQREQRVVRFEATFAPYVPIGQQPESSLDRLLDAIANARLAAESFLQQALAPLGTAFWLAAAVETYAVQLQGYWQAATGSSPGGIGGAAGNPQLATAVALPIASLGTVGAIAQDSNYASSVVGLIAAVPDAIAGASATFATPAVGPGDAANQPTPIDGRVTMSILLAASTAAQAQFAAPSLTASLALTEATLTVLDAISAATDIAWTSAQEAQAALAQMLACLDAAAAQAAALAAPSVATVAASVAAGQLWDALQAARGNLIADMTATIGRLPQVRTLIAARTLSAWLAANILAGDAPDLIVPAYSDLVARNALRHPALLPAGPFEALAPASIPSLLPGAA